MSAIQDCLSRFSIAVWSQTPEAERDIETAISAYLAEFGPDRSAKLRALETLRDCYGAVVTASPAGETVRRAIRERMAVYVGASRAA